MVGLRIERNNLYHATNVNRVAQGGIGLDVDKANPVKARVMIVPAHVQMDFIRLVVAISHKVNVS